MFKYHYYFPLLFVYEILGDNPSKDGVIPFQTLGISFRYPRVILFRSLSLHFHTPGLYLLDPQGISFQILGLVSSYSRAIYFKPLGQSYQTLWGSPLHPQGIPFRPLCLRDISVRPCVGPSCKKDDLGYRNRQYYLLYF